MEFFVHIEDRTFIRRIQYVFDFIAGHPTCAGKISFSFSNTNLAQAISYGSKNQADFSIPAQKLLFSEHPLHPNQFITNTYAFQGLTLYSVENKKKENQEFLIQNQFSFDIIETIFFHISRYEEHIIQPDMKENWGLGYIENHFIPRNNLAEIPVVDHLVFAFLQAIGLECSKPKTSYRLTHDVDNPIKLPSLYKLIKASGRLLLVEKKGLSAQRELFKTYFGIKRGTTKDPYDTFDWLFRREKIEKVVYFMAGGITKFDNFYQIDSPIARRIIKQARESGYKIGLHPSYEAYANEALYKKEKEVLEKVLEEKVTLARQHYLRFQFPETAKIIDNQGIVEDSTLGYRDMIGFRCGTGFGFRLYNFEKEEAYNFTEVPLVIMEWSLIEQDDYDFEKIKAHLASFLEKNQYLTKVTFLFHNSIFDQMGKELPKLKKLYQIIIKHILN